MKPKEFTEPTELLPDWGPYSKKYMGISKVVSAAPIPGARFDCVVHPMQANANQPAPNVTYPSSWHIWEAAPDLSYFAYRVEMEWKDQVYADVSFSKVDGHTRLIRTEYVNHTDMDQNCVLNYYLSMEYPWKQYAELSCERPCVWKKMTDYDEFEFHTPRAWNHLMPDGLHRGEFFDPLFLEGRGLGERTMATLYSSAEKKFFGQERGDYVTLSIKAAQIFDTLTFRYRTTGKEDAEFVLTVCEKDDSTCAEHVYAEQKLVFAAAEELAMLSVPVSFPEDFSGERALQIKLVAEGRGGIEFDFAALHDRETPVKVETLKPEFVPECRKEGNGFCLIYKDVPETFGFLPLTGQLRERQLSTGTLEDALVSRLSQADPSFDRLTETFTSAFQNKHSDDGFYQNFIVHSIFIPAGESHVEYALVGDVPQGGEGLKPITRQQAEEIYRKARGGIRPLSYNTDGEGYALSNRILQATLLTNVVYPIYHHGDWIKHHTPGKRWDSLYTWDSGFIGLGLLESEPRLAEYVLDLYLSQPDNQDFAFLMHGSPVPVQAYLYLELLQRSRDKARLFSWYPRLKRYYCFLAGKSEGSVTDPFKSRLTTTFDYFYNCSGMDDLPPQVEMYRQGKKADCAPALTTSQLIRMAKILRMAAAEQGLWEDVKEYEEDIALRADALQRFAWDEESGYFGYVVHDEDKNPTGVFRTAEGENLSKGMDGIYPLIAGVCTKEQEELLISHIFSEKEMFSRVGISAVDMTASYYQPNGYWNGNVWFSHQWFIWKTMLDLGRGGEAYRIARTALDAWKREVDHSYYTFEMLNIATARGGWFHQFGGLSSPINIWADAYYKPGTVTCGFDLWIQEQVYDKENDVFELTVTNYGEREEILLAVTRGGGEEVFRETADFGTKGCSEAKAYLDGMRIPACYRTKGAVEVTIPAGVKAGKVTVKGETE